MGNPGAAGSTAMAALPGGASPARARTRSFGLNNVCKRMCVRAQCTGKAKRCSRGGQGALQVICHGGDAAVRHRRRRSSLGWDLRATTSSANGRIGQVEAHRGPGVEKAAAQDGRHRGLAAALDGARGGGRYRSSPCSWTLRIVAWSTCEGATAIREARGSPVVRN